MKSTTHLDTGNLVEKSFPYKTRETQCKLTRLLHKAMILQSTIFHQSKHNT